jgi:hypothetical protein
MPLSDHAGLPVPSGREVAGIFQEVTIHWHELNPALDWEATFDLFDGHRQRPGASGQIALLGLVNCFQWHLEDACRASYQDPARLARIKFEIDRSNARRIRAIDDIDRRIARELAGRQGSDGTRRALTTPGQVIDRLSIQELKRFHARMRRPAAPEVLEVLSQQLDHLCLGLDELVEDLAASRLRLMFFPSVKLYGDEGNADGSPW